MAVRSLSFIHFSFWGAPLSLRPSSLTGIARLLHSLALYTRKCTTPCLEPCECVTFNLLAYEKFNATAIPPLPTPAPSTLTTTRQWRYSDNERSPFTLNIASDETDGENVRHADRRRIRILGWNGRDMNGFVGISSSLFHENRFSLMCNKLDFQLLKRMKLKSESAREEREKYGWRISAPAQLFIQHCIEIRN